MVLQRDVTSVLGTMRSIELMKDVWIVIERLSEHPVEIMAA
ncbi:hypothetical protein MycrhDRAFT_5981 [Mycolicibacterium rhodesiae JS60]|nr:hypothetical protein MycrhDRAFT_5981 [Mycolicibacterium rhodesiae JS60]